MVGRTYPMKGELAQPNAESGHQARHPAFLCLVSAGLALHAGRLHGYDCSRAIRHRRGLLVGSARMVVGGVADAVDAQRTDRSSAAIANLATSLLVIETTFDRGVLEGSMIGLGRVPSMSCAMCLSMVA
jgi:hypothetical protein